MTKEETRQYDRNYYARKSEKYKQRKQAIQRERIKNIQIEIIKYKMNNPCKCGENHPASLQFHHSIGFKKFNISDAASKGRSLKTIMSEIKKCIVMCANCHAKIHWIYPEVDRKWKRDRL